MHSAMKHLQYGAHDHQLPGKHPLWKFLKTDSKQIYSPRFIAIPDKPFSSKTPIQIWIVLSFQGEAALAAGAGCTCCSPDSTHWVQGTWARSHGLQLQEATAVDVTWRHWCQLAPTFSKSTRKRKKNIVSRRPLRLLHKLYLCGLPGNVSVSWWTSPAGQL